MAIYLASSRDCRRIAWPLSRPASASLGYPRRRRSGPSPSRDSGVPLGTLRTRHQDARHHPAVLADGEGSVQVRVRTCDPTTGPPRRTRPRRARRTDPRSRMVRVSRGYSSVSASNPRRPQFAGVGTLRVVVAVCASRALRLARRCWRAEFPPKQESTGIAARGAGTLTGLATERHCGMR